MIKSYINKYIKNNINSDIDFESMFQNHQFTSDDKFIIDSTPGEWSIDKALTKALLVIFENFPNKSIVEFGAGYSSIVFNYASKKSLISNKIISIEENLNWFKVPKNITHLLDVDKFNFIESKINFKIGNFGIYVKYDTPVFKNTKQNIDLVLIDGPQQYYGREGNLDEIYSKLNIGALIVLDDAGRYLESCLMYKWLKVYKGLELIYYSPKYGERGLAILEVKSKLKKSFSISVFLLGLMQGSKRYLNTKFNKKYSS